LDAAFTTVVGVMVEVPVILLVVKMVNAQKVGTKNSNTVLNCFIFPILRRRQLKMR
jgi:hypothetical protein